MDFGVVGSPATLDPYSPVASELTYELAVPVYPSLFHLGPRGKPHTYLAKSLTHVPGGVRVTLRPAKWSNGRPVTAADVVASWRRARPPSGFARIGSAKATGRREILFRGSLRHWYRALATVAYVLPGGRPRRLSAGPFRIVTYRPGLDVVFRANPRWWAQPALRTLKVEFVQGLDVLLLLLREGKLDAAAPPSTVNLSSRLAALGLHQSAALGWESVQIRFPGTTLTRGQRLTFEAAIDRRALAQGFIRNEGRPATTLHPGPAQGGARGPWSHLPAARAPIHGRVTLSAPAGDELMTLLQRALQIQLSGTISDLELVTMDPQTFYGRWRTHNPTDAALTRVSGGPLTGGAEQAAYRGAHAFPLFQVKTVVAWRDGIHGLDANPTFDGPLWNAATWSAP